MNKALKILIVEGNSTAEIMLLKAMLVEHQLTFASSGEQALELTSPPPDLILLEIKLSGIDGYETCRQFREIEQTQETPVIFLTSCSNLQDRIDAFDAGGSDYISKPFDARELMSKIGALNNLTHKNKVLKNNLAQSHDLILSIQTTSSMYQRISRFIQVSQFCPNLDTLIQLFMKATKDIGLKCVVCIKTTTDIQYFSSDSNPTTLEKEILDIAPSMKRIHSFGKDRAIYRWEHVTLLARNVGDLVDVIAILMDALESAIKSISSQAKLLNQVTQIQHTNTLVRQDITGMFTQMREELLATILSLGIASGLAFEEENKLTSLIESYGDIIDSKLSILSNNNLTTLDLIEELNEVPDELKLLINTEDEGEDDDIDLF